MKITKVSVTITLLVLLNAFLFLWYHNPISFLGTPRVPDEATAIAIARTFKENSNALDDGRIFVAEYIEGSGRWLVQSSPPRGWSGRIFIYVIRARDGRPIDFTID